MKDKKNNADTPVINVEKFSTYFTVEATAEGFVTGGYSIMPFLNRISVPIMSYDGKHVNSWTRFYGYRNKKFYIPIHAYKMFADHMRQVIMEKHDETTRIRTVEHAPVKAVRNLNVEMKPNWQDRPEHAEAFKFILESKGPIVGNNLQTGKGKTYVAVKLFTIFKTPTLVVCDGLDDQWEKNFIEKTTIPPDKIFHIKGKQSIQKLWKKIDKNDYPWVIIGSTKTMVRYAVYGDKGYTAFPTLDSLTKKLGIGLVIYDEIHLNTRAAVRVMVSLNVEKNIILSATPMRASAKEQRVFNIVFPNGVIGGANLYDKYVNGRIYGYDLKLGVRDNAIESYLYGYSHIKYESVLLGKRSLLSEFLSAIDNVFANEYLSVRVEGETRCLIFASTVEMVNVIAKHLNEAFGGLIEVKTYVAHDPNYHLESEVIVSTPKSCGTGKDIAKLVTVINTVSINSKPGYMQMLGRLRRYPGHECRFIDMINVTANGHMRHAVQKLKTLRECCKEFDTVGVTPYQIRHHNKQRIPDIRKEPDTDFSKAEGAYYNSCTKTYACVSTGKRRRG